MRGLIKDLKKNGCEILPGFPMSSYTAMKVGGEAEVIVYPQTQPALLRALKELSLQSVPFTVLGGGTNTIVRDGGFEGAVVSTCRLKDFEILPGGVVSADCGASLAAVMNGTARMGFSGLEFAAGIPGTVGGAVFMNAGANGGEMAQAVESVAVWHDGCVHELRADELDSGYRRGGIPSGAVVLSARLRLRSGNSTESVSAIRESLRLRKATQPVSEANTGSIFKNPPQIKAGRLLEELGMKSFSVGSAEFSPVHANFIVNKGGATTSDVLELISIARDKALRERGIDLETEVCVI